MATAVATANGSDYKQSMTAGRADAVDAANTHTLRLVKPDVEGRMGRRRQQEEHGGGRRRGGGRAASTSQRHQQPELSPALSALREAEALQQRGERRKGGEAAALFQQSAECFQRAIGLGLPEGGEAVEAHFGLGESLQRWGTELLEVGRTALDEQQSAQQEAACASNALDLLQQAVRAFSEVVDTDGRLRVDAALNCANCLCAASDLAIDGGAAEELLRQSLEAYGVARAKEEDALTLGNMADAYVKLGELACRAGEGARGEEAFRQAVAAYQAACSLSDSASGDDLAGLLYDWGVALYTMAAHTQDGSLGVSLLNEAGAKLRDSAAFDRGDPQPLNAIGDVLVALAEREAAAGDAAAATDRLEAALREGFRPALHLNRANTDAMVGCAEVHALQGKAAARAGNAEGARSLYGEAAKAYGWALQHPTKLGTFSERCDVRYNYGCALAAAGQDEQADRVFAALLHSRGDELRHDLLNDADMAEFRSRGWFQKLIQIRPEGA